MRKIVLIGALLAAACAPKRTAKEAAVAVADDESIEATMPSGTVVVTWDEYEAAAAAETPALEELDTYAITVYDGTAKDASTGKGLSLGKYRIGIQADASYLDGCVRRRFLHLKIVVENANIPQPMAEIHLLGWFENSGPCFAIMNTGFIGYGWCQKICASDIKEGIKKSSAGALTAAGVSAVTAAILSKILAPVAAKALGY